ncbi:MAG: branched-chain amino acid ABC transporter permease [Thermofilaceae archaeon]|nr:branched-chain amino acid ABC transporter permease [Thermofilaceae archaeon]MCX8180380.1 branched-chain amino acid ABC transporter permease [Thermofilaceae archaeon]MDW8003915.1 branched-chain amino acid ABC transporter permease [Thermofilaceae archaeon]
MIEVVVGALVYSNLLAMLSVGLNLILLTCKVSNFAHGDFVMVGVYTALTVSTILGVTPYACLPFALIAGGVISFALYRVVFEPLRTRANLVMLMVVSMALDIILRYSLHIYADLAQAWLKVHTRLFLFDDFLIEFSGVKIPGVLVFSSLTSVILLVSLYLLLFKTRLGTAMRASIENPELAEALGVNVKMVFGLSWFLSGALAAAAGVFLPFRAMVSPDTGWSMLLPTFASVIVGGVGSLSGSLIGAYTIGVAEVFLTYVLASLGVSTAYRPLVSFSAIITVLLVSPKGLSGFLNGKGWKPWKS